MRWASNYMRVHMIFYETKIMLENHLFSFHKEVVEGKNGSSGIQQQPLSS